MCEKTIDENHSFIGRQGHFAQDYEKSARDQNREIEKISQVGDPTNSESGHPGAGTADRREARQGVLPHSLMEWLAQKTREIGISNRSPASEISFRVARSVAYRAQMRAERAQIRRLATVCPAVRIPSRV